MHNNVKFTNYRYGLTEKNKKLHPASAAMGHTSTHSYTSEPSSAGEADKREKITELHQKAYELLSQVALKQTHKNGLLCWSSSTFILTFYLFIFADLLDAQYMHDILQLVSGCNNRKQMLEYLQNSLSMHLPAIITAPTQGPQGAPSDLTTAATAASTTAPVILT